MEIYQLINRVNFRENRNCRRRKRTSRSLTLTFEPAGITLLSNVNGMPAN